MSTLELRNCEFAYRCHAQWEWLLETAEEQVRFCIECGKAVHRCETDAELLKAIRLDHCVAIAREDPDDVRGYRFLAGIPRLRN